MKEGEELYHKLKIIYNNRDMSIFSESQKKNMAQQAIEDHRNNPIINKVLRGEIALVEYIKPITDPIIYSKDREDCRFKIQTNEFILNLKEITSNLSAILPFYKYVVVHRSGAEIRVTYYTLQKQIGLELLFFFLLINPVLYFGWFISWVFMAIMNIAITCFWYCLMIKDKESYKYDAETLLEKAKFVDDVLNHIKPM